MLYVWMLGIYLNSKINESCNSGMCFWNEDNERGVNPLDPSLRIKWPIDNVFLSDKDRAYDNFKDH